jgi:hypothetical protein
MPTYVFGYKPIQGWLAPIITVGLKLYYLDSGPDFFTRVQPDFPCKT